MTEKQVLGFKPAPRVEQAGVPSECRIASIGPDDAMILPHDTNPGRIKFSEGTTEMLSSVPARRRSSEPQVVTAQLIDGPAAHQLHIAFDFGSEIFKRPFNAGLTRGR
jgi:hypothetical protein